MDYFVSPSGSDAASTPPDRPFATIGKAARTAKPGDTVHVGAGVYSETVNLERDGEPGRPIRFVADVGAVLAGSFRARQRKWLELVGFNVVGPKKLPVRWEDMPAVVIDDAAMLINIKQAWAEREPTVRKRYATYMAARDAYDGPDYSLFTAGIWLSGCSDVAVRSNTVSYHTIGIDADDGCERITTDANTCHHCRDGIWSFSSDPSKWSLSDSTLSANVLRQNLSTGIALNRARGVLVRANVLEHHGIHHVAISSGSEACRVEKNIARHGGFYSEAMRLPGSSAFNFYAAGPGNVCVGNRASYQHDVTGNDGNGFIADTMPSGVLFEGNVAWRCAGSGITFTEAGPCVARSNVLAECGYQSKTPFNGAGVRYMKGVHTIRGNVFHRNRTAGIQSGGGLVPCDVDGNIYSVQPIAVHDSFNGQRAFPSARVVYERAGKELAGHSLDLAFAGEAGGDFSRPTKLGAFVVGGP